LRVEKYRFAGRVASGKKREPRSERVRHKTQEARGEGNLE